MSDHILGKRNLVDTARTHSNQIDRERQKKTAEIFTPRHLIDDMLDRLPSEAWTDPSKTFLEPSCGDGNFLEAIHERLMVGLTIAIPDPVQRHAWIIENMIYAIDLMPDNVEAAIDRINARGLLHNIRCADTLAADLHVLFSKEEPLFQW